MRTRTEIRALSIRQPSAWLIVNGYKDIENRSYRTHYRGPLLIHAGKTAPSPGLIVKVDGRPIKLPKQYDLGGIVGIVTLEDCVTESKSPSSGEVWVCAGQSSAGAPYPFAGAGRTVPGPSLSNRKSVRPSW